MHTHIYVYINRKTIKTQAYITEEAQRLLVVLNKPCVPFPTNYLEQNYTEAKNIGFDREKSL